MKNAIGPTERKHDMRKFLDDFKSFAIKGNIMDLAVGVIIGGAFSKIVTSLVQDIIMPVLSLFMGKIDLAKAALTITKDAKNNDVLLKYGAFLQNIIDFLIISLSIFIFIRLLSRFRRKQEIKEEAKDELKLTKEAELLAEIRDLLKSGKSGESSADRED